MSEPAHNAHCDGCQELGYLDKIRSLTAENERLRAGAKSLLKTIDTLTAENERLRGKVERVEALLFRHYTGSPGFERTPSHILEIDAIEDLYDDRLAADLRAALD